MVFGIIGENCSGKSTLAEKIKTEFGAEIITGKDYLRMAKSESETASGRSNPDPRDGRPGND